MQKAFINFIVIILFATGQLTAQVDPHFSQYYTYTHFINPAAAGVMNADYRVAAIYRNQWSNINHAFRTAGLAADITTNKKVNLGADILNQSAANGGYNYTTGYISAAFTGLRFGNEGSNHINIGLQAGLINRNVNPSKFEFGDQWNPVTGYSAANPTADIFTTTNSTVFDAAAGIFYYNTDFNKTANPYFGIAAFHINKPADPFTGTTDKSTIPMRVAISGGVNFYLSDRLIMVPNFLYMKQGTADEKMLGTYFQISANETTDFLTGINYRFQDAVVPYAGMSVNNLTIGVSYDVNLSPLGRIASGSNAFELTLTISGKRPESNTDYFKCPRL
ncbi:hypothetical protein BH09BAC2_BH09BAC2_19410 [soil metagenome]